MNAVVIIFAQQNQLTSWNSIVYHLSSKYLSEYVSMRRPVLMGILGFIKANKTGGKKEKKKENPNVNWKLIVFERSWHAVK